MKLIEDKCQYEREITGEYAALSFADVSKKELDQLREIIAPRVYTLELFGHLNIISHSQKTGSWVTEYTYSSPRSTNKVEIEYYEGNKRAIVFIHGPKTGAIELKLRELVPEEERDRLVDLTLGEK